MQVIEDTATPLVLKSSCSFISVIYRFIYESYHETSNCRQMKAKSLVAVAITLLGLICQQAMLAAAPPIFVLIYIDDLGWTYTLSLIHISEPTRPY